MVSRGENSVCKYTKNLCVLFHVCLHDVVLLLDSIIIIDFEAMLTLLSLKEQILLLFPVFLINIFIDDIPTLVNILYGDNFKFEPVSRKHYNTLQLGRHSSTTLHAI